MDNGLPIVRTPQRGQTLKEYLQTFSDTELRQILEDADLSKSFSEILQESFRDLEVREDRLQNLSNIIDRLGNFERLEQAFQRLKPVREKLLRSLQTGGDQIEKISNYCALGRFVGSTVDIAGTIGGLWLKESGSPYANWAFRAATSFGLLAFASTTSESALSKNIFNELLTEIHRDQELMAPVKRWYEQCEEINEAVKSAFNFPFGITDELVSSFRKIGEDEFTPVTLLSRLLATGLQDVTQLRDERLIRNLIRFTSHPDSRYLCEWMIFFRHPVMLDIARIILQLQTSDSLLSSLCQSIPALPIKDQNILSVPVLGRIGFNIVSVYNAIHYLRTSKMPAVASAIRHLREHLEYEILALEYIVSFAQSRRNRQR